MIQSPDERRPPITPQLAMRVAVLGGVAFTLFAIVFFRLWFLQVLTGDQYLAQARDNRVRQIAVEAARGEIVDRNGAPLVTNRPATAVEVDPEKLPPEGSPELATFARRLGGVIGMSPRAILVKVSNQREQVRTLKLPSYLPVTLKTDVAGAAAAYLAERQDQFAGIDRRSVFVRFYPHRALAAQLFGTVGEITKPQLELRAFRGLAPGARVGQGGIEAQYDEYLRGKPGAVRLKVDAAGREKGRLPLSQPKPGQQLRLSLDLGLQSAGDQALARALAAARANGHSGARAGAFVALDPRDGEVLALGSAPSVDANELARPLSVRRAKEIFAPADPSAAPLANRALQGLYPTGSTFKPITALAALSSGLITPDSPINDPGFFKLDALRTLTNAGRVVNGVISLRRALAISSDVFFYTLGYRANGLGPVIQRWAHTLGLGRRTGIDLPGEASGAVPDAKYVNHRYEARNRCLARIAARKRAGEAKLPSTLSCGFFDRPWSIGDNVNLAVGQGYLEATPLQMAVAYAALANGGRIVKPHLGLQVETGSGRVIQQLTRPKPRRIDMNPAFRQAILDGLRAAASGDGTSGAVFKGFPYPVYGKTGTAQRNGQSDQSWYVCFVLDKRRPIVIAVTVEKGGFGAEAAAPAARWMLSQWLGARKRFVAGTSKTR